MASNSGIRKAPDQAAAVKVEHLTVSYGSVPALLDVSFEIPKGKLVGILGPNGSGKSTLMKTLLGFIPPDFGKISFFGKPIDKAKGTVAYVPQRGSVDWDFPVTVREVAEMGRFGHVPWWKELTIDDREIAKEALRLVGMQDYADRQIGQLSGGQQQRVFMARALAQGGDILLLDEPFAGVDVTTEKAIIEVFQNARHAGKTLIVVHHDLSTSGKYFDLVVLIRQRLFAVGPPDLVLTPELLSEVYEGKFSSNIPIAAGNK